MSEETANPRAIHSWAEEDRPREKLLLKGRSILTNAELLAILIGSGTRDLSAVDVGKLLLAASDNNLNELARKTVKDLIRIRGIGEAKAITIVAALELGRRRKESDVIKKRKITHASDVYEEMRPYLADKAHEEFWILLLSRSNEVLRPVLVSIGGMSGTVADPKVIFKHALEHSASSLILVHNHPSGNLNPSQADKELTRQLQQGGKLLDIPIIDHVIFTDRGYFGFADEGLL
jgi:DNA repair protein RadC